MHRIAGHRLSTGPVRKAKTGMVFRPLYVLHTRDTRACANVHNYERFNPSVYYNTPAVKADGA